jgi:hypothetical protein
MARRTIDSSMLQGLVEGSQNQEVQKGTPRTTDPKFPVFATPVNSDILVYIPRTNVISTENGDIMQTLPALIHEGKNGKMFTSLRCISGLNGNPVFDQLGYDGTCPCCEATQDVWELYRIKLGIEAQRIGVDPQNDPQDVLKPMREKILQEMDLKGAEEFVTFPIVIIPTKGKFQPADDALENLQVVYVHWRKKRYVESILGALDSMMINPGHPAGLFWLWKFSYDTGGKQATAMMSAKNAKYTVIQDQAALTIFEPIKAVAENKSAEFTMIKAAEVIVANQFMFKEDIEIEVNKIMTKTRQMLEMSKVSGAALPAGQQPVGALPTGAANPLAGFGVSADQSQAQQGAALGSSVPANLGQSQPTTAGQPAGGAPVTFGG